MKKTLISLVLVFALLSTCVFSAVFAKYSKSSEEQTITATVSGFGITLVTVSAKDTALVPGGNGILATTSAEGTLKVDATLTYTAEVDIEGFTLANDEEYCPVVFTVDGKEYGFGKSYNNGTADIAIDTIAKLETALAYAITQHKVTLNAANYATTYTNGVVDPSIISWAWAHNPANNDKDTQLGDGDTITVTLTATIAQN